MAETLYDSLVGGWVGGAADLARDILPSGSVLQQTLDSTLGPAAAPPPSPPTYRTILYGDDDDRPGVELPALDRAIETLANRRLVTPDDFYSLSAAARHEAFTVAGDLTEESIARLHDAVADDLAYGTSRTAFLARIREEFPALPIGEAHVELVYRNAVNQSYSQGMDHVLDHPLVDDEYPYRLFVAIHDDRVRSSHLALESTGIDGTAVYHKDDPAWGLIRPPVFHNCRCGWIPLSIADAAAYGAREAQEWIDTGVEPAHPPQRLPSGLRTFEGVSV